MRAPAGARAAGPLENTANNSAKIDLTCENANGYRAERWAARALVLWPLTTLDRVRGCGRYSVRPDGSVQVRANGVAVGFHGLASCGSVWSCPVCNSRIMAVRALELRVIIEHAFTIGGGAAFGALTLRHHRGHRLADLLVALSSCWNAVNRDGTVTRTRKRLGHIGYVRTVELLHGSNGWHPHIHPVHLFDRPVSDFDVALLHRAEVAAWSRAATRLGYSAQAQAQHLHAVTERGAADALSSYVTKATYTAPADEPSAPGIRSAADRRRGPQGAADGGRRSAAEAVAWEVTGSSSKDASRGRTHWRILSDIYRNADADDLDLWHEHERATKGKRAVTYSRGLRARVGLDVEATDEDIASTEIGTAADAGFDILDWSPFREDHTLGPGLLAAIGKHADWTSGRAFCITHGIEWRDLP